MDNEEGEQPKPASETPGDNKEAEQQPASEPPGDNNEREQQPASEPPAEPPWPTNGGPLGCLLGLFSGLLLGAFLGTTLLAFDRWIGIPLTIVLSIALAIVGWKIGRRIFREYKPPKLREPKPRAHEPKARVRKPGDRKRSLP